MPHWNTPMFKYLKIFWNYLLLELEQPFKKCPIQAIFDKVIKGGYYTEGSDSYMCLALSRACYGKKITFEEYVTGKKVISEYLDPSGYHILEDALKYSGAYPSSFEYRLNIYKNWDKRPNLGTVYG